MKNYNFQDQFRKMNTIDLIWHFNLQVENQGWVAAKFAYITSLVDEIKRRRIDLSAIETQTGFSLSSKIIIEGNKVYTLSKNEGGSK